MAVVKNHQLTDENCINMVHVILLRCYLQQHGMGINLIWIFRTTVKANAGLEEGAQSGGGGTQVVFADLKEKQLSPNLCNRK